MSILSGTGKIYMVREPVCGRFGIHRLLAMLSSNSLNVHWNGIDEVTIVTFNKRKTICKVLHIDPYGVDCTSRILNSGRFQVMLDEDLIPIHLTRDELEQLLLDGTSPDRASALKISC